MPQASSNGITLEYHFDGNPGDTAVLLVNGLGGQLTSWDDRFVGALVERNLFVVRFDNRDVGRSTWFDRVPMPELTTVLGGDAPAPYLLSDMADDAEGLLEALGMDAIHVVGISMGGMIAQELVIRHAPRVASLTSVMSTTGAAHVGQPSPEAVELLLAPPPAGPEEIADRAVKLQRVIGSPGFPFDERRVRDQAIAAFERAHHPDGTLRQAMAVVASPDRTELLRHVRCPTLVVHGSSDVLVDPSGGRATAAAVPGAVLRMVDGMGHDIPPALYDDFADLIAEQAHGRDRRAS
jgi:pimeloyl-ACP methyl ester carboxylesterase